MKREPKQVKCKACKGAFTQFNSLQNCCSPICASAWKNRKKRLKERTIERKEKQIARIGLYRGKQHNEPLQKKINEMVRLLDEGKQCIARPESQGNEAGHVHGVGAYPSLRYNLNNIYLQCTYSNKERGGEPHLMLAGIEREYGLEQRDLVDALPLKYPILKLSGQEKYDAIQKCNRVLRELRKGQGNWTRDKINKYLGIYK